MAICLYSQNSCMDVWMYACLIPNHEFTNALLITLPSLSLFKFIFFIFSLLFSVCLHQFSFCGIHHLFIHSFIHSFINPWSIHSLHFTLRLIKCHHFVGIEYRKNIVCHSIHKSCVNQNTGRRCFRCNFIK